MFRLILVVAISLLIACDPQPDPAAEPEPVMVEEATDVITGRLFRSSDGTVAEEGVVVLAGDRIACSGEASGCRWPEETPVHSFPGSTILPGLIDLHVHARPLYVRAFLSAGVTAIRDANNDLETVRALRESEGAPRIFASGPLLDGPDAFFAQFPGSEPGHPDHQPLDRIMPVIVEDPEEARSAVAALADAGADLIKLYEQIDPDAFRAAVTEAQAHGVPVAADVGTAFTRGLGGAQVDIVEAAEAGVTTVEHLSGLALAYQRRGADPFDPELDEDLLDEIARALLDAGTAFVPTAATPVQFDAPETLALEGLPGVEGMEPHLEGQWGMARQMAAQGRDAIQAELRLVEALFRRLHEGGAQIGAGSDLPAAPGMMPGWGLHQELEALVRMGMTPTEALRAATSVAAEILNEPTLGHLESGARADLVVVRGDPTSDITVTRQVAGVWFGGRAVDLEAGWRSVVEGFEAMAEAMGASP